MKRWHCNCFVMAAAALAWYLDRQPLAFGFLYGHVFAIAYHHFDEGI